jgi:hypothetical protein
MLNFDISISFFLLAFITSALLLRAYALRHLAAQRRPLR